MNIANKKSAHAKPHRGTIFLEDAEVLDQQQFPGQQFVLRLKAPECASRALPGSFIHLSCDAALPMRRPMSIMRVSRNEGWIECLYKVVGEGTRLLSARQRGDVVSSLGPIGQPFELHPEKPRPLLIGGGVGIPPMIFLAEALRQDKRANWKPLLLMGSEIPFPFKSRPSTILLPGMPDGVIGCMPLMEDWNIPSRLASQQGYPGCYDGFVTDLARRWLKSLDKKALHEIEIFACGPTPMLKAAAHMAQELGVPSQVSLEEFMACAVGGCAGCAIEVQTPAGPAMKRVCVDGPVFDGASVFPTG
ncbi:MAG TPA: dihydroorotate dehydrogenase electron transfer subunit [Gammaproteobacteria bacterium]|nr:dihydroorotate dehydrogenase electron transfer subunit [Gammaproteobacteria bacterium]HVC27924.1 dihydroorotate dehydrogenase electron transfer subunit [Gammaproteobacteria bacterium]